MFATPIFFNGGGGGGGGGLPLYQNIKHFIRKSHEFSQFLTQTILTSNRYATFMETYASGTRLLLPLNY